MPKKITKQADNSPEGVFRKDFRKVNKPAVEDKFLPKVSDISSEALSDYMMRYAAWREFTEDLLMEALADFTRKKEEYDHLYSLTLLKAVGSTVKEKEARTDTNLDVRENYLLLQDAELYYDLLSRKLESYNNCLTVISREITRRTNRDA